MRRDTWEGREAGSKEVPALGTLIYKAGKISHLLRAEWVGKKNSN